MPAGRAGQADDVGGAIQYVPSVRCFDRLVVCGTKSRVSQLSSTLRLQVAGTSTSPSMHPLLTGTLYARPSLRVADLAA